MAMSKRTKALSISREVKEKVYERDSGLCIWCNGPGLSEAHFVPRGRSGLGIEENILTLCRTCHREFDFGRNRAVMMTYFKEYLEQCYPDWNEEKLVYRRDI
jgi:5-methylcytosine-specific restriction endonuclease McrA